MGITGLSCVKVWGNEMQDPFLRRSIRGAPVIPKYIGGKKDESNLGLSRFRLIFFHSKASL
jgi:hypothetical protein